MRRNVVIGLFAVAVAAIVAGDFLFTRTTEAQEPAKKSEPAPVQPNQLFELLKKDLETKKDEKAPPPPLPVFKEEKVVVPPPAPVADVPKVSVPAPAVAPPSVAPPAPAKDVPPPAPNFGPAVSTPSLVAPKVVSDKAPPAPQVENRKPEAPPVVDTTPEPAHPTPKVAPLAPVDRDSGIKPAIGTDNPRAVTPAFPQPVAPDAVKPPQVNNPAPLGNASEPKQVVPAGPKGCVWSFQVDLVDQQTIVTATVNKKHAFKIVCKHVDLQTEQGVLKAKGNVQISGDALEGTCSNLSIPLGDDRLVLDGAAEVRIRKTALSVSEARPSQFELKGETLNLRVSELQSGKYIQTSMRQTNDPFQAGVTSASLPSSNGKSWWSQAGKLRQTKDRHGDQSIWCLENASGQPICRFVLGEGRSLAQYEGRTVSVLLEAHEKGMERVTHIALP